jgi:hypothetical protein
VAAALVLTGQEDWLALIGTLLLAMVSAGTAVMCWVDSGDGFAQAGLTLVLSLVITGISSAVMIWSAEWHPAFLFIAITACSWASCITRLLVRGGIKKEALSVTWENPLPQLAFLGVGLIAWAYGLSQVRTSTIGPFGLLASVNVWYFLGLGTLLISGLLELYRTRPRIWLLSANLTALIVVIHSAVPILYNVPEYSWVYKHIGVAEALGQYGHVTDPSDIYQQWPVLFSAVASISDVARVGPLSFAQWGPVFFELANALLLLGILRLLGTNLRTAFLGMFLYEGLIAWVGQDYLSPQAFGYLLWFGVVTIVIRWFRAPQPRQIPKSILARVRAPFLVQQPTIYEATGAQRITAAILVAIVFFAIVAAHQLTPYIAMAGIGFLVIVGLLRHGWLLLLMLAVLAFGYLAPRYGLISQQFGGVFSGGNAIENASGVSVQHTGADAITAEIVRGLAVCMWLGSVVAIAFQRRALSKISIVAALAFSPFVILAAQNYGGEAIYRVYLFSAPWCAFLIAGALAKMRVSVWHRLGTIGACSLALAAGLQGLYGPLVVDGFTHSELAASLWLYSHAKPDSAIILAADNFPTHEVANYNLYDVEEMPSDPQLGATWLNEANVNDVENWIRSLGESPAYVVFSRSMANYASYYSAPRGYAALESAVRDRPGWTMIYHDADTVIYRLNFR